MPESTSAKLWLLIVLVHFALGELVEILPDLRPEPLPVLVVVAHRHNLSRRVRFFIDWLEQILQPYLDH